MISNDNLHDGLKVKGSVSITLTDQHGQLKQVLHVPNLLVDTGKRHVAARIVSDIPVIMSYMAIGSDDLAPRPADESLVAERARVKMSSFSAIENAVVATATFGSGSCDGEITEAGIFDSATDGIMMCRTTFQPLYKELEDTLSIVWTIEFISATSY